VQEAGMEDLPDPLNPVAVPDDLVQARAANLAVSALGLGPAVHELVARLRLPLPHERDLDHNKDPDEPMPSWGLRVTVPSVLGTEVRRLIRAVKEADVYLCAYNGAPLAVKAYRLDRTSHRGGRPIKVDKMSWLAAHEFEMMRQGWKGGASVTTPARRVENLMSMRYIGNEAPAPRLH